jgi:hypothetical protein
MGAWTKGFEYDIFISYARVDDATVDSPLGKGWVSEFFKHLNFALGRKMLNLSAPKIWRDTREIQGDQTFDQTIETAIRDSAVFLALTSRAYLGSAYCKLELQKFHQKAQGEDLGLVVGDRARIYNLLLNPIPFGEWPSEYPRTSGFKFHDTREESDGEPSDVTGAGFQAQIRDLASALFKILTEMKERQSPPAEQEPQSAKRFRIFVADAPDTLASVRKRLINEVGRSPDVSIATAVPPPWDAPTHDSKVQSAMESADLSVHLLDAIPGREVEGAPDSYYPERQVELAMKHSKSRLIWVPNTLTRESIGTLDDKRHAAFLEKLETKRGDWPPYDFQRDMPSSLSTQILARVESLKTQTPMNGALTGASFSTVLDTHIRDQAHTFQLYQYLAKQDSPPLLVPEGDDPKQSLSFFTECLRKAGVLIIFYGSVGVDWVRERLHGALQIAVAENCPLKLCGVYVAPPQTSQTQRIKLPLVEVEWMDHTSGFNAAAVDNLLKRARALRTDNAG